MAYAGHEFRCADTASYWAALQAFMVAIGWEIHDSISATRCVYKSRGESGKNPYLYVDLEKASTTTINCTVWLYWNATTHSGLCKAYCQNSTSFTFNTSDLTVNRFMGGDKDMVMLSGYGQYSANGYAYMFGHLPYMLDTIVRKTTDDITAGNNVSIPVDSSAGLGAGTYVQIVGVNYEGRDRLAISTVPDSTHIVVATLPRNYASGAYIGVSPMPGGATIMNASYWYPVAYYTDSGTTNGTTQLTPTALFATYGSVNAHSGMRYLSPVLMYTTGYSVGVTGKNGPLMGMGAVGDLYCLMDDLSVPPVSSVTSASASTLVDSSKSWTPDDLIGKYAVISNGTGSGQIRKISDNDATSLTIASDWVTTPDGTSEYKIFDTAYRYYYLYIWKITSTVAPS